MCLYTVVIPAPAAALSLASQIEELRACVASASAPESSSACSCGSSRAPFTLRWPRLPIAMVRGARRGAGREAEGPVTAQTKGPRRQLSSPYPA